MPQSVGAFPWALGVLGRICVGVSCPVFAGVCPLIGGGFRLFVGSRFPRLGEVGSPAVGW